MLSKLNAVTADIPTRQNIKDMHLKEIYLKVLRSGGLSRAQLKNEMKLSFPSISALVDELIEAGILVESEAVKATNLGRPRILLRVKPDAFAVPVVKMVKSGYVYTLFDSAANTIESGSLRFKQKLPYTPADKRFDPGADTICEPIEEWLSELKKNYRISDLVLCVSGRFHEDGTLHSSDLRISTTEDVYTRLRNIVGGDIKIMSTAVCFTYAERIFQRITQDFMYIYVSGGVGACTIRSGKVYGDKLFLGAGEIGHASIDYNGRLCSCGGRGCLERYVSIPAICEDAMAALGSDKNSCSFEYICEEYNNGNPVIEELIGEKAMQLAVGITNAITLQPVEYIVIGGGIERLGPKFLSEVRRTMLSRGRKRYMAEVKVSFSEHIQNDEAVGALWNYLDNKMKIENIL